MIKKEKKNLVYVDKNFELKAKFVINIKFENIILYKNNNITAFSSCVPLLWNVS